MSARIRRRLLDRARRPLRELLFGPDGKEYRIDVLIDFSDEAESSEWRNNRETTEEGGPQAHRRWAPPPEDRSDAILSYIVIPASELTPNANGG